MSARLSKCFEQLKQEARKALVPYIVAGDPDPSMTVDFMHTMVKEGASIIELGVPFSDPMADGPSIQKGHERALAHKVSCKNILSMVEQFRKTDTSTPIVLMGYLNPIEIFGYQAFADAAKAAGVDALLIVDLPPEEAAELKQALNQLDIDLIFLIAPTTTKARIQLICEQASGFLYYVSLKGVTGAGNLDIDAVNASIEEIRKVSNLPINVGFGIKDGESAARLAQIADGVVVGSTLVDQCASTDKKAINESLASIIRDIRSALDH